MKRRKEEAIEVETVSTAGVLDYKRMLAVPAIHNSVMTAFGRAACNGANALWSSALNRRC